MYIRTVNRISSFMTASAATAPKARKTRTRKPKAAAAVKAAPKAQVRKPVVKTVTAPRRPSTAKLISFSRYVQDAKQRWAIHEYEINALFQDISKGYVATSSYVKDSYSRAFN